MLHSRFFALLTSRQFEQFQVHELVCFFCLFKILSTNILCVCVCVSGTPAVWCTTGWLWGPARRLVAVMLMWRCTASWSCRHTHSAYTSSTNTGETHTHTDDTCCVILTVTCEICEEDGSHHAPTFGVTVAVSRRPRSAVMWAAAFTWWM